MKKRAMPIVPMNTARGWTAPFDDGFRACTNNLPSEALNMKKILAIILLAVVLCVMTACSFSSSSTSSVSVSSSVTDEEGNTETNTVSSEAEVSVGSDGVKVTAESTAETTTTEANN